MDAKHQPGAELIALIRAQKTQQALEQLTHNLTRLKQGHKLRKSVQQQTRLGKKLEQFKKATYESYRIRVLDMHERMYAGFDSASKGQQQQSKSNLQGYPLGVNVSKFKGKITLKGNALLTERQALLQDYQDSEYLLQKNKRPVLEKKMQNQFRITTKNPEFQYHEQVQDAEIEQRIMHIRVPAMPSKQKSINQGYQIDSKLSIHESTFNEVQSGANSSRILHDNLSPSLSVIRNFSLPQISQNIRPRQEHRSQQNFEEEDLKSDRSPISNSKFLQKQSSPTNFLSSYNYSNVIDAACGIKRYAPQYGSSNSVEVLREITHKNDYRYKPAQINATGFHNFKTKEGYNFIEPAIQNRQNSLHQTNEFQKSEEYDNNKYEQQNAIEQNYSNHIYFSNLDRRKKTKRVIARANENRFSVGALHNNNKSSESQKQLKKEQNQQLQELWSKQELEPWGVSNANAPNTSESLD